MSTRCFTGFGVTSSGGCCTQENAFASTCPMELSGTGTSFGGWLSVQQTWLWGSVPSLTTMTEGIAILGAGKMGEALLSGMVRAGRPASSLVVTTRDDGRAQVLRERYGVEVTDNVQAVKSATTIVVAVKPQDMGTLLVEIAPELSAEQLL